MGLAGAHRAPGSSSDVPTVCGVGGWFSRVRVYRPPPETDAPLYERRSWADGFSSTGGSTLSRKPHRYFASDVPAERRSSHASTTRFAMPASAALPQARGS